MLRHGQTLRLTVQPTSGPSQYCHLFYKMTSTIIVIMMPKILRSMAIPKSPYPRIVPQQNRQTQYYRRPVRCINMSIPFPNWQVPLHKGQMHEPGSRHHRLRQLLTPTARFSTASSVQSTGRRPQKARTFYAYRAACMKKYFGHSLLVNASVTAVSPAFL